jgi:hypothetical protein
MSSYNKTKQKAVQKKLEKLLTSKTCVVKKFKKENALFLKTLKNATSPPSHFSNFTSRYVSTSETLANNVNIADKKIIAFIKKYEVVPTIKQTLIINQKIKTVYDQENDVIKGTNIFNITK